MIDDSYQSMSDQMLRQDYHELITVEFNPKKHEGEVFIFKNIHVKKYDILHLKPFLKEMQTERVYITKTWPLKNLPEENLTVIIYSGEIGQHSPPKRDLTIAILKPSLQT